MSKSSIFSESFSNSKYLFDTDAVKIYENIISLPIDQRYEGMHMEYLAQVIKAYFKEEKQDGIN